MLADNGDVIVAMNVYNENNGLTDVYLQRINLDQEHVWGEAGIQLDTSSRYEGIIEVYKGPVNDTYLIHWVRRDEDYRNYDLRLQLINGDGDFLWGIGGIGLNRDYLFSLLSKIVTTSDQCVIAAYTVEDDNEGDIEVHKIASDGERLWSDRYIILGEDYRLRLLRDAESDRSGGAIILYDYLKYKSIDDSITYYGINVMRISGDGDSLWTRQVYEREKESGHDPFRQCEPIINYAGSGRFFVAWVDYPRNIRKTFQVVSLDIDGEYLWDEPVDIITSQVSAGSLDAVDSFEGVCYVWREAAEREDGWRLQQWGQRISADGERLWGDRGRAIQARNVDQSSITTDGNGGVITVVEYNPTVQMINRNGEIGVVLETPVDQDNDKHKSLNFSPQLFIYPNPGNTHFRIEYETGIPNEMFSYGIYNLLGRTIKTGIMMGGHTIINDLSPFSSGEYILRLQSARRTVSTRFLLIK